MSDLQLRRLLLYPAELQGHKKRETICLSYFQMVFCREFESLASCLKVRCSSWANRTLVQGFTSPALAHATLSLLSTSLVFAALRLNTFCILVSRVGTYHLFNLTHGGTGPISVDEYINYGGKWGTRTLASVSRPKALAVLPLHQLE